jgi:hypothetical protein
MGRSTRRFDCTGPRRRAVAYVLALVMVAFAGLAAAQAQTGHLESRRAQLEEKKLELEVAALTKKEDQAEVPAWLTGFLGLLLGAAGTGASVWAARRARQGALDQEVHKKRIESYPHLVNAMSKLALYFPPVKAVGREDCRAMGETIRAWYFEGGGLLMSTAARDAYFVLARALTRASSAERLCVPEFPKHADYISSHAVDEYRRELAGRGLDDVEKWVFGGQSSEANTPALRYKDFVFLQTHSSALRTELCADLHSRRRPS